MGPSVRAESVRPLGASRRTVRRIGPPRPGIILTFLAVGVLLGWLGASLGMDGPAPPAIDQQDVPLTALSADADAGEAIAVVWAEAAVVPDIQPGWELADHSGFAECGGRIYIAIRLRQSISGDETTELWSSEDGLLWASQPLRLGVSAEAPRLAASADSLLLTARTGAGDALWQGTPSAANDIVSWRTVQLRVPDGLRDDVLTTATTDDGDVTVVMIGDLDIWPEIIAPFLPESVAVSDAGYVYDGDEYLRGTGDRADIRLFAEPPEVVVADQRVWVRIVTLEGEEVLRAVPLPTGVYPMSDSPPITDIRLASAWTSTGGREFIPVTALDAMPNGYFRPQAWGDTFVAAAHQPDRSVGGNGGTVLWRSDSGRAWLPDPSQPPQECSPYVVAVSGESIYLTSEEGTQCRRDLDTEWIVLGRPCTVCYKVGGAAGFLGYPRSFEYDRGVVSRDGVAWSEIAVPTVEPYPTLAVLEDRFVSMSVCGEAADQPSRIRIWVGKTV